MALPVFRGPAPSQTHTLNRTVEAKRVWVPPVIVEAREIPVNLIKGERPRLVHLLDDGIKLTDF